MFIDFYPMIVLKVYSNSCIQAFLSGIETPFYDFTSRVAQKKYTLDPKPSETETEQCPLKGSKGLWYQDA